MYGHPGIDSEGAENTMNLGPGGIFGVLDEQDMMTGY